MSLRTKETVQEGIVKGYAMQNGVLFQYEPGNGTRYEFVFTTMEPFSREEHETQEVLVSWLNSDGVNSGRCCIMQKDGSFLASSYVKEKLKCMSRDDAFVIAEFLGYILDRPFKALKENERGDAW